MPRKLIHRIDCLPAQPSKEKIGQREAVKWVLSAKISGSTLLGHGGQTTSQNVVQYCLGVEHNEPRLYFVTFGMRFVGKERKNFVRSGASPAHNEMADHERIPFDLSFKIPPVGTHLARTQDGILLNLPSRVSPRGTKPKFRCLNSRNPDHKLLSGASPVGIQAP